jgi:hypothetical protein
MRSLFGTLLLVVMLLGGISPALAASITWDGGGANTLWSTTGNWSTDTVPGAGDIAVFDATSTKAVSIPVATSIGGISISSSYTGVITKSGGVLLTIGTGSYAQGGGTLKGGTGSIIINGSFAQSGGTFRAPTGALRVVKGVTRTGGSFVSNHGTFVPFGSGGQTLTAGNAVFNNILFADNGLIGHWRLDEASGTLASDAAGGKNNGTYTNAPVATTDVPTVSFSNTRARQFDGTNDCVLIPGFMDGPSNFSISIWMKRDTGDSQGELISIANSATIRLDGGALTGFFFNGGSWLFTSSYAISDASWHHVTYVFLPSFQRLYVDGVLRGESGYSSAVSYTGGLSDTYIGGFCGEGRDFKGSLDDVRIYNRVLNQNEITRLAEGYGNPNVSDAITLASNLALSGSLTIHSTLDVSSSNYSVTASGSWLNNGGIFTARSGTVTLNGAGRQTLQGGGSSFSTLRILSSSGTTLTDSVTVGSALTIGAGAVLSVPTYTLTATTSTITNAGTIRQTSGGKIVHTGDLAVSPSTITPGNTLTVSVTDTDANTDGTALDTLTIYIRSEAEDVTLTETAVASGIFTGTIATANGTRVSQNGTIEVDGRCGTTLEFVYTDAQDTSDSHEEDILFDASGSGCGASTGGGSGGGGGGGGGRSTPSTTSPSSGTSSSAKSASSTPGSIKGVNGSSALSRLQQRKLLREKRRSSRSSSSSLSSVRPAAVPAGPSLPLPPAPASSNSSMTHRIKVYAVNLRQWASYDAPRLAVLPQGKELIILRTIGSWLEIQLPSGQTGFVIGTSVEGK